MRTGTLLAGAFLLSGCVSQARYQKQSEALARSLELNRKSIDVVERLEKENEAFRTVYGDAQRISRETELRMKGGELK